MCLRLVQLQRLGAYGSRDMAGDMVLPKIGRDEPIPQAMLTRMTNSLTTRDTPPMT